MERSPPVLRFTGDVSSMLQQILYTLSSTSICRNRQRRVAALNLDLLQLLAACEPQLVRLPAASGVRVVRVPRIAPQQANSDIEFNSRVDVCTPLQ